MRSSISRPRRPPVPGSASPTCPPHQRTATASKPSNCASAPARRTMPHGGLVAGDVDHHRSWRAVARMVDGVVEQARHSRGRARVPTPKPNPTTVPGWSPRFEGQIGHGQHLEAAVEDAEDEVSSEIDAFDVAADLLRRSADVRTAHAVASFRPAGASLRRGVCGLGLRQAPRPRVARAPTRARASSSERFGLACHAGFRLVTEHATRRISRLPSIPLGSDLGLRRVAVCNPAPFTCTHEAFPLTAGEICLMFFAAAESRCVPAELPPRLIVAGIGRAQGRRHKHTEELRLGAASAVEPRRLLPDLPTERPS